MKKLKQIGLFVLLSILINTAIIILVTENIKMGIAQTYSNAVQFQQHNLKLGMSNYLTSLWLKKSDDGTAIYFYNWSGNDSMDVYLKNLYGKSLTFTGAAHTGQIIASGNITLTGSSPTITSYGATTIDAGPSSNVAVTADAGRFFTSSVPIKVQGTNAAIYSGSGTPESSITAAIGSIYMRTDGGASTSIYVKESGTGNTGWVAK